MKRNWDIILFAASIMAAVCGWQLSKEGSAIFWISVVYLLIIVIIAAFAVVGFFTKFLNK